MCGIAGLCVASSQTRADLEHIAIKMGSAIGHRGPDSSGVYAAIDLGVALSHQRLAILDISASGHQPMQSSTGRYIIAFNGEIYNHLSLRDELDALSPGPIWHGHSDTETLLSAIEAWGLEIALQRSVGMWGLALLDLLEKRLYLARDRFGEKPLYWGISGSGRQQGLVFASELAALRSYPAFDNSVDHHALSMFLQYGQVPAPLSIYSGIFKLPPGHLLSISLPYDQTSPQPIYRQWWNLNDLIQSGYRDPLRTESDALNLLESTLREVVADQAIADVPLGSFLSGGIDSTLITALLQHMSGSPVRTFTISFEDSDFNEAPYARDVAAYLGTEHVESLLTSSTALALIPDLPQLYSEPFADSSQLPTHLVCRQARYSGLKVALSGDGGDELFGGYNRYLWFTRIKSSFGSIPSPLRRSLSQALALIPPTAWNVLGRPLALSQLDHKAAKLVNSLRYIGDADEFYRSLISEWLNTTHLLQDPANCRFSLTTGLNLPLPDCLDREPVARMMAWDSLFYLPDDILTKVDRAAMAVGLETRAPFLDHRLAAVAWRLPIGMKLRAGTSKWALRQILFKYVPRELIERPKTGFAIPIGHWLRGPLRAWADGLLHPDRLQREGYLRPLPITQLWQQHLSGRYDHTAKLWRVLMWQAWLEQWG